MATKIPSSATAEQAAHLVHLDADHPGFRDRAYRLRRDAIAQRAIEHRCGDRPPHVNYTAAEQQVWSTVWEQLRPLHERFVCREVRQLLDRTRLHSGPIPQLAELDRLVRVKTGFAMQPVAGLVTARDFLVALADRVFLSTQYVRHPSAPLYTPEPDLVHEYIGHSTTLLDARFAHLHEQFGKAAIRANAKRLEQIERVYWFTVEYGMVQEDGQPKALGAGLLSSSGELAQVASGPELLAWDLDVIATTDYDPTQLQPRLFVAPSFDALVQDLQSWLGSA